MKRVALFATVGIMLATLMAPVSAAALPLPPAPSSGKVAISPGEPSIYEYPTASGIWYLDASVANWPQFWYSSGVPVIQPVVSIQYLNASDTPVGGETFAVPAVVMPFAWSPSLPSGYYRHIHRRLTLPATAVPAKTRFIPEVNRAIDPNWPAYHYGMASPSSVLNQLYTMWTPSELDDTTLGGGRTILKLHVTNEGPTVVGPIGVTGNESYEDPDTHLLDTFEVTADDAFKASRLGPGDSTTFTLRGLRATPPAATRGGPGSIVAEAYPLLDTTVYRFYNVKKGAHFYTASASERDYVMATWPTMLHYEGPAYTVQSANPVNSVPLHRFYNVRTGVHFYTANGAEKDLIIATWPTIMHYEGIAYYVAPPGTPGANPVYRFYNLKTGVHFYTASESEKNSVLASFPTIMRLEGPAFSTAWDF